MKRLVFVLMTSLALISVALNMESRTLTNEEVTKLYCEYEHGEFISYEGTSYETCNEAGDKENYLYYWAINEDNGHKIYGSVNEDYARYVVSELSKNN